MVLIELVFALAIFSIIALYSMNIVLNITNKNHTLSNDLENILKLEATRLFIQKHPLSSINLINGNLIYNGENLLLNNVSKYNISKNGDQTSIYICLEEDSLCQNWIIK